MTIDERLQFLRTSTESLHVSTQELHASITKQQESIQAHSAQLAIDAEHIRALMRIVEAHEQRRSHRKDPGSTQ